MSAAFNVQVEQRTQTCCNCGVLFSMPAYLQTQRIEDKRGFYCPNGHEQCFTESEADKLRRELTIERTKRVEAEIRAEKEAARARALDDQVKRVGKGVCPCCKRSFTNVRRHMRTKHPELAGPKPSGHLP